MLRSAFLALLLAVPTAAGPAPAAAAGPTTAAGPAAAPDAQSAEGCDPVDPAACLLPFPSDLHTVADPTTDTGIRVALDRSVMPKNVFGVGIDPTDWNRNDGFSPGAMLLTRVPGLDPTVTGLAPSTDIGRSLAPDAPIVLVNTRTGERHPYWAELDANAAGAPDRQALVIRPARNLDENTRYAVGLRHLRTATGAPIPASELFVTLRAPAPPADPALRRRWEYAQRAVGALAAVGVDPASLHLAWDFTVASERSLTERIRHLRDEAFDRLGARAPAVTVDTVTDHGPDQDPDIRRQVTGTVRVPSYLDTLFGPPGARLRYGPDGLPEQRDLNTQVAKFHCNIPHSATAATPARPALYGHGLLGSPTEIDSRKLKQYARESNTMLCATAWIGMASGDIPNVVRSLADFSQFGSIPDRTQQGFLNFLWLGRALIHTRGGVTGLDAFRDATGPLSRAGDGQLVYLGNSQGGILGGALCAVATDFTRCSLGVPAANYSTLLDRSVDFDEFHPVFHTAYPDPIDRQLCLALAQMLWDRGEANGYLRHLTADPLPGTPAKRVIMIEAFGDHQVANVATEAQARTIGARLRTPALAAGRSPDVVPFWGIPAVPALPYAGSVLVPVDSGSPAPPAGNVPPRDGLDPHGHPANSPQIRAMIARFLDSGELVDTCAGAPCTAPAG
ncbi:hypothetical protein O7606_26265 [Micromonospora sp. WMMD882]|uniref:hypothetical protein n=1 Tax=Micromonospora sp. WMMD882 TaxID=3015151 RepID=UPI00248BDFA8|nr:hypothetical protein [Micromonospora sp. WMMD882]WBB79607.1 hypothetical protein O7606_26265 [Micromonospora sp. WMMD882]